MCNAYQDQLAILAIIMENEPQLDANIDLSFSRVYKYEIMISDL